MRIWRRVMVVGKVGGRWLLKATICSGKRIGRVVEKVTGLSKAAMQGASLTPRLMQIGVCWYWREVWSCSGVDALGEGLVICPKLI